MVTGARDALDVLIVPKARTARDVWWVDVLLTQLETKLGLTRRIGLEVLIEEAEGLANAAEIARSSDRLEAIIFGAGDLSASLHARVDGNFDPVGDYPGDFWHFARVQVLAAARAAGIDAIDAPVSRPTRTPTATGGRPRTPACSASTASGPSTPTRSPSPTRCSPPPPRRSADAEEAIEVYRASEAEGVGAIGRDGRLVDAAHMRLAANVLHKAALADGEHDRTTDERRRCHGQPPTGWSSGPPATSAPARCAPSSSTRTSTWSACTCTRADKAGRGRRRAVRARRRPA